MLNGIEMIVFYVCSINNCLLLRPSIGIHCEDIYFLKICELDFKNWISRKLLKLEKSCLNKSSSIICVEHEYEEGIAKKARTNGEKQNFQQKKVV